GQVVDVDTGFTRYHFIFVNLNNDTAGVDIINHTTTLSHYGYTRVFRYNAFNTSTYQWLISTQCWYRLTLHVRTHQCTVSIVVLKERDQSSSHRYDLLRSNVHVLHLISRHQSKFVFITARY